MNLSIYSSEASQRASVALKMSRIIIALAFSVVLCGVSTGELFFIVYFLNVFAYCIIHRRILIE